MHAERFSKGYGRVGIGLLGNYKLNFFSPSGRGFSDAARGQDLESCICSVPQSALFAYSSS